MKPLSLFLLISVILLSCEDRQHELISWPDYSVDINSDSVNDYQFSFYTIQTTDVPSSGSEVFVEFQPLNENSILYHEENGYNCLEYNDTLRKDGNPRSTWNNDPNVSLYSYHWSLTDKESNGITFSSPDENIILGLKYSTGSGEEIAWIEIDIDEITAETSIIYKGYTDQDSILIEK